MDTAPNSCSVGNNVAGTLQSVRVHRAPAAYRIIRPVITDQDFDFIVGADRCDGLLNIARPTLMRDRVRSLCYEWLRFLIGPLWRKTVFARHGVALRWGRPPWPLSERTVDRLFQVGITAFVLCGLCLFRVLPKLPCSLSLSPAISRCRSWLKGRKMTGSNELLLVVVVAIVLTCVLLRC